MMIVFDSFFFLLGMQAVSLLQIDGKQTASGTDTQHKQGDTESKEDISGNEAEEGCSPRMPINSKGIWRPLYTG